MNGGIASMKGANNTFILRDNCILTKNTASL